MIEKKVRFKSRWLPWVLLAPQLAIVLVFFFWPAGQALYQSVLEEDAFGMSREFVGMQNFARLFNDPLYLESFQTTALFSVLVAVCGLSLALLLAVMADRVWRAASVYKTLLIWPYAVAPAVAGVLWLFLFASPNRCDWSSTETLSPHTFLSCQSRRPESQDRQSCLAERR